MNKHDNYNIITIFKSIRKLLVASHKVLVMSRYNQKKHLHTTRMSKK